MATSPDGLWPMSLVIRHSRMAGASEDSAAAKVGLWLGVRASRVSLVVEMCRLRARAKHRESWEADSAVSASVSGGEGMKPPMALLVRLYLPAIWNEHTTLTMLSGPSDTDRPWRMNRGTSGNFEGVLGFGGGPQSANISQAPSTDAEDSAEILPSAPQTAPITGGWRERLAAKQEAKKDTDVGDQGGYVGGSPWSGAQKHWRAPVGQDGPTVELDLPVSNAPTSISVIASPAATPVPNRDAMIEPETPAPPAREPIPEVSQESLDAVQWFYRDPQQQEHGKVLIQSYAAIQADWVQAPSLPHKCRTGTRTTTLTMRYPCDARPNHRSTRSVN